ncbi:tRNA (adenosine(37)-N6)-threonylcarbamoyltransferase complex ATPase subunit type 1 TsaE [Mycoplasmopsis hyopharyngis]|uniref:tRNA (adenosine(37)-N6)-threonylcarbamoyltransferase complex ATPase subunit type 1 TsaE n=1 Tax=Mycoplasmopsis hyopharyngis TaxID=29558 RepID=UPI0038736860
MQKVQIFEVKHNDSIAFVADFVLNLAKQNDLKIICLNGELGVGKTQLTKEIAKLLQIKEHITSPTFNYLKLYPNLVHIDAYNLKGNNLDEFYDYFEDNYVVIEWANLLNTNFAKYINVDISLSKNNTHIFSISYLKRE